MPYTQEQKVQKIREYRRIHECGLVDAKKAIAKEELIQDIDNLQSWEAVDELKDILKRLACN